MSASHRVAVCLGEGRVELARRPLAAPACDEVVVRVAYCALCGSDRHAWAAGSDVVPGHEVSGTVSAAGASVAGLELGTPGVVYLLDFCGACRACRSGATNICTERRAMYGFTADGGLADHVRVSARCFVPVPDELDLAHATALLDLFGTTLHALRRGAFDPAQPLAVLGCGPIGAGTIAVARALGAREVYATDVAPYRLALAERLGARVLDARDGDVVAALRRLEPEGFSVVVEAAGRPETQRQALALAGPGGRAVAVAHSPAPVDVEVSRQLIAREVSFVGSEYFPVAQVKDVIDMVIGGRLDPAPLISHRFALDDVEPAYRAFFDGETAKVLVAP